MQSKNVIYCVRHVTWTRAELCHNWRSADSTSFGHVRNGVRTAGAESRMSTWDQRYPISTCDEAHGGRTCYRIQRQRWRRGYSRGWLTGVDDWFLAISVIARVAVVHCSRRTTVSFELNELATNSAPHQPSPSYHSTTVHSVHLMNVEQSQAAVDPQTKPRDLSCEFACRQADLVVMMTAL